MWCSGLIVLLIVGFIHVRFVKKPEPYKGPAAMMGLASLVPSERDMVGCFYFLLHIVWCVVCIAFWIGKSIS